MRVVTGLFKGRRLVTVAGNYVVRPTPQMVKEAVFSAIQFDIEGRRFLDLFAGCGQMGIEALSRGAASAVFVDASEVSLSVVKQNLKSAGAEDNARVIRADYSLFLSRCSDSFDIAFLDPPYGAGILEAALKAVIPVMSEFGVIICEHPTDVSLPEETGGFKLNRSYRYGKIAVSVFRKAVDEA